MSEDQRRKRRTRRPAGGNVYALDDYRKGGRGRKKKAGQMRRLSVFVFVLFLIYICFYVGKTMSKEQLSETRVIMGSIELPQTYTGIIVRDEKTYPSGAAGVRVFQVSNGDRVKKGTVVCGIQDAETVAQLTEDLSVIDENIIDLQENRMDYSIYQSDIDDLNSQIKKTVDHAVFVGVAADMSRLYDLKTDINQKLAARNKMLLGENKGSLVSLVNERKDTENQLNGAVATVATTESGVVSYQTDGLEASLTMENLYGLTKEQTVGKPEPAAEQSETVAADDPAFKLVRSNNWYIVAYLPAATTDGWASGDYHTLYIQNEDGDFAPFEAIIDAVNPTAKEDERYVVFKCNTMLIEFLPARSLTFKTVDGVNEGLKLPNTAIADKTLLRIPKQYVFTIDSGVRTTETQNVLKKTEAGEEQIPITVVSSDDEAVYVLQDFGLLRFGDTIVNSRDNTDTVQITEIKNAKGVYVTNTGVMVFKEISMEGRSSANSAYTVVDPAYNTAISNQDMIVSDVQTMETDSTSY